MSLTVNESPISPDLGRYWKVKFSTICNSKASIRDTDTTTLSQFEISKSNSMNVWLVSNKINECSALKHGKYPSIVGCSRNTHITQSNIATMQSLPLLQSNPLIVQTHPSLLQSITICGSDVQSELRRRTLLRETCNCVLSFVDYNLHSLKHQPHLERYVCQSWLHSLHFPSLPFPHAFVRFATVCYHSFTDQNMSISAACCSVMSRTPDLSAIICSHSSRHLASSPLVRETERDWHQILTLLATWLLNQRDFREKQSKGDASERVTHGLAVVVVYGVWVCFKSSGWCHRKCARISLMTS